MIWTLIILTILVIIIKFSLEKSKDKDDLHGRTLDEKFSTFVSSINNAAFNGSGYIKALDERSFNLCKNGENQIINFFYGTGHLTITWRYKYYQKEVKHERQFNHVRNLSVFEQQRLADSYIMEMYGIVEKHKYEVEKGIF